MSTKSLAVAAGAAIALLQPWTVSAAPELELNVTAYTSGTVASDWTAVYYSDSSPLLISNDGGTATGGFHVWDIDGESPLHALKSQYTGRTKLLATVYGVGGKDYLVSIPQTTPVMSAYQLPGAEKVEGAEFSALGDWSAICTWKSQSANNYIYVFGKHEGFQLLIREKGDSVEFVEVWHHFGLCEQAEVLTLLAGRSRDLTFPWSLPDAPSRKRMPSSS